MEPASSATDPFALPAFILSIVGLVVAAIGAGTGIASLVWQIVTRTRGAHRVVAMVVPGLMLYGAGSAQGPFLRVDVINRGASAVQVDNWGVELPDGNALWLVPLPWPPSPSLPHLLEPGTSASFLAPQKELSEAISERDAPRARALVYLATGEKVRSKRGEFTKIHDPRSARTSV